MYRCECNWFKKLVQILHAQLASFKSFMIGAFIFGHNFNKKLALLHMLSFAALCFSKRRVVSGGAARTMQEYCKEDDAEQAQRSSHDRHTVNVLHWSSQFSYVLLPQSFLEPDSRSRDQAAVSSLAAMHDHSNQEDTAQAL